MSAAATDETLRPGEKIVFSKSVLELLLAGCAPRLDIPEGAVSIAAEFTGVTYRSPDGIAVLGLKRLDNGRLNHGE